MLTTLQTVYFFNHTNNVVDADPKNCELHAESGAGIINPDKGTALENGPSSKALTFGV